MVKFTNTRPNGFDSSNGIIVDNFGHNISDRGNDYKLSIDRTVEAEQCLTRHCRVIRS